MQSLVDNGILQKTNPIACIYGAEILPQSLRSFASFGSFAPKGLFSERSKKEGVFGRSF